MHHRHHRHLAAMHALPQTTFVPPNSSPHPFCSSLNSQVGRHRRRPSTATIVVSATVSPKVLPLHRPPWPRRAIGSLHHRPARTEVIISKLVNATRACQIGHLASQLDSNREHQQVSPAPSSQLRPMITISNQVIKSRARSLKTTSAQPIYT